MKLRILTFLFFAFLNAAEGAGRGKPPTSQPPGSQPPASGPSLTSPVRGVFLKSVGTRPFQVPNGKDPIQLNADLDAMLRTSVTNTGVFAPIDRDPSILPPTEDCDVHLEVRAAVTTLELDIASLNLTVGYTPSGSNSVVTGVNGTVGVKVGAISMDFGIWECVGGECQQKAASVATHAVLGGNVGFEINFSEVSVGPELILRSPLGNMLRKIMDAGLKSLSNNARIHQLAWIAPVRESHPENGTFIFGAGQRHGVDKKQLFEVYAATGTGGSCDAYKVVAYAKPFDVHTVSTDAQIETSLDPRGVKPGDWVMIRARKE